MSNRTWTLLALLIALAILANGLMGWNLHVFLGRKFDGVVEWAAFWR